MIQGVSNQTLRVQSDGTLFLLSFIQTHIAEMEDVDLNLTKKFLVKQRAEFLMKQGCSHWVTRACGEVGCSRQYYYDNKLAGNL